MQALGARAALLAHSLGHRQALRGAFRACRISRNLCSTPLAAAPPPAKSGGKASAGAAAAQQQVPAASSSGDAGQPQLPRVILKGGKAKLFTGEGS